MSILNEPEPFNPICVVAIDLGTSGTGFAFTFKQNDYEGVNLGEYGGLVVACIDLWHLVQMKFVRFHA